LLRQCDGRELRRQLQDRADHRPWRTRSQLELAIVAWVGWYNHQRLHSSLDDMPPVEFEAARIHDYAMTGTV